MSRKRLHTLSLTVTYIGAIRDVKFEFIVFTFPSAKTGYCSYCCMERILASLISSIWNVVKIQNNYELSLIRDNFASWLFALAYIYITLILWSEALDQHVIDLHIRHVITSELLSFMLSQMQNLEWENVVRLLFDSVW